MFLTKLFIGCELDMFDKLTKKEYEIMRYIWENDEGMSFGELYTYVHLDLPSISPQTLNTHLCHLIEKEFVRTEGNARKRLYHPLVPRTEYDHLLANRIVEQLFDGSLKKFISALTLNRALTEKEAQELKALIKRKGG